MKPITIVKLEKTAGKVTVKAEHRFIAYPADCRRLQAAFLEMGFSFTIPEVKELWEERSELWSAGWLDLPPTAGELADALKEHFDIYPGP